MTHYFTRVHTFWCDEGGCNQSFEEAATASVAWMYASEQGWQTRGGKHYCPAHEIRRQP